MADVRRFCPTCGFIDLEIGTIQVSCPNCSWTGTLEETVLAAESTEKFYGIEEIGSLLINVAATHAAGPLLQTMQHVGLLPRTDTPGKSEEYNAAAQAATDHVMRRILEGCVKAAFEAAGEAHEQYPVLRVADQN